jgi:cellobiose-specific phosphotransferase system component IIC
MKHHLCAFINVNLSWQRVVMVVVVIVVVVVVWWRWW